MAGEPTLKRGHNNPHDWVEYAQKTLNYALAGGIHLDVPENGVFDETFEQEVIAFQSQHGLGRDGVIGPNTWAALHKSAEAKHQASAAQEAASAAQEDDQLQSPPREVHSAPGHEDDNAFHQRTDKHGNTVRVYDMDAQTITADAHLTTADHSWNEAVNSMIILAKNNAEMQITYVLVAVQEFQTSSRARIDEFAQSAERFLEESHVQFPWGLLVDALEFGLSTVFEIPTKTIVEKWGNWIYEKVKGALTSQLKSDLEARADPVANLKNRLEAGVAALTQHVEHQTAVAVGAVVGELPDYIKDVMSEYKQVSDQYDWIKEMVAWFGFPTRTTENVTQPILQNLNEQFDAMIQQAEEEVLRSR
jgi:Putative peptidoglycan binding domain